MTLKTLKDFDYHSGCEAGNEKYLPKEVLRQEAIKHIKCYIKKNEGKAWYEDSYNVKGEDMIVCWIKDFFNITEDDLK